ncbi:MAG: XRE family transcriptional regulator [Flavobacteriia bacterium]|nr:XRE family transcriptional regulator [Flavobacteriia bacterium]
MKNVKTFDQLLDEKYEKKGNTERNQFDADSLAFRLGAMLKEARVEANLTQEELAQKTGTKKSYISRIERGLSDIQFSTYYKLIELGLGKHLNISIG